MGVARREIDMVRLDGHSRLRDPHPALRHQPDLPRIKFHEGIGKMLGQQDRRGEARVKVAIGRAHVRTPVTNAKLVCRTLLDKKKTTLYSVLTLYTLIISYHCP